MFLPIVFTALGWAIGRAPDTGTVICVLVVGPVLGVVLDALPTHEAMAPRLAHFVVGFLLVAAGITAVIIAAIGPGPAELVMPAIHDRGYPLAQARTAIEIVCVAARWALAGPRGAATLGAPCALGPHPPSSQRKSDRS